MALPVFLHLFTFAAVVVAAIAVIAKVYRQWSMPIHLRWEVYPVPKEGIRSRHGGSYYEDVDWWARQRHESLLGELRIMLPEMLFLKALWENNRKLWYWSFPFHFGLYFLVAAAGLVVLTSLMAAAEANIPAGIYGLLTGAVTVTGVIGLCLGTVGALGLLHRRLFHEELEGYTAYRDIINLVLFLIAFGSAWAALVVRPSGLEGLLGYVESLFRGNLTAPVGGVSTGLMVGLFSFLIAYVPLSHMSHFFLKYFTYHKVRWEDTPNLKGSKMEKRILTAVNYRVSWAAQHISADGKKTWADIATEEIPQK